MTGTRQGGFINISWLQCRHSPYSGSVMTQWTAWPGFSGSGSNAVYEASLLRFKPHVVQSTAGLHKNPIRGERSPELGGLMTFMPGLLIATITPQSWRCHITRLMDGCTGLSSPHRTQGESILHLCDRPRYTIYDMMDGRYVLPVSLDGDGQARGYVFVDAEDRV
ncbi:hypothetical protein EDD17DRAFT_1612989 [Pisolithus thermaeus]|nr:hypothetical protein EDD17DRAFT_1612989 [Pisolithus thermaeus]